MGMQKSLSKTKHFNLFYLFFFINIYNIVVVFVFSYPFPPPPNLYPIKKMFPNWDAKFPSKYHFV